MIYWRNITLICLLSFSIILGFFTLIDYTPATPHENAALNDAQVIEAMAEANGSESIFATLLGIAGLVYLKIIWKLIHSPDILNDTKDKKPFKSPL